MKSFKIDFESMTEEDLSVIKSPTFFLHDDFGITYVEFPFIYPTFVFNKETLQAIINLIKGGYNKDSQEILELLSQKVDEECFDLKKSNLDSRRNKKISYASTTWDNKKRQIIEEGDDYYIMGGVPNGETADGRARTYKVYKSLEATKKAALEYVDGEIERLQKLKDRIENE